MENHEQTKHIAIEQNIRQSAFGVLEALLYSSVFISCCAFGLTVETYLLKGLEVSMSLALFVFLATLFTYNISSIQSIIRRPQQAKAHLSKEWGQRHKKLLAMIGAASVAGAGLLYVSQGLDVNVWFMLHLGIISVGYTVPIVNKKEKVRPLRSIPLLKVFLIAYVWAAVTVLFPLMDADVNAWNLDTLLLFIRRFLLILALALLFDIRDYVYDRGTKTLTIPGLLGVQKAKLCSLGLLLIYLLLVINTESGSTLVALAVGATGAAGVVVFSTAHKPRLYYALLADGAMLLHAALVYLAKI
ncbi:hypothetical protein [Pontibacter harenae]|uniref:hypothetical protein n=1 Tax=Pontibacter harenae TaxID=2894083 RepID=UPI001E5457CC|nr:hypothetical protein [Pontibacter harenae]MCC9168440.1 hypothetical protein [Pontibacter harenae]